MGLIKIAFMFEYYGENKTDGMEYLWLIECENSATQILKIEIGCCKIKEAQVLCEHLRF